MIRTGSQAMIFATVSRVFVLIKWPNTCRIFASLRSRAAPGRVDRVRQEVPNDGDPAGDAASRVLLHVDGARPCVWYVSPWCFVRDVLVSQLQKPARTGREEAGGKGARVPAAVRREGLLRGHLNPWFFTSRLQDRKGSAFWCCVGLQTGNPVLE